MTEDELNLWRRYRQADEAAYEELVLHYLPLVSFWVKEISKKAWWATREDLTQDGIIGLIKAVKKFDPDKGVKFTTYARHYIRGAIYDSPELTRNMPRSQDENSREVRKAHDRLMQKLEREPTIEEIAEEIPDEAKITVEEIGEALAAMSIAFPEGLTGPIESAQANTDTIKRQEEIILIQDALSRLSERESLILIHHCWGDQTFSAIGKKLGLEEAAVSKIYQRAIIKLKELYGKHGEGEHYES
jgi:RNA polymerase sigma factor (sigma-70 family)